MKGNPLGALFFLAPIAGVYSRVPMEAGSDSPLSMYFTLAFYFLAKADKDNWAGMVCLAALFNGLAWGTKYVALAFMTPALLVYLLWQWKQIRFPLAQTIAVFFLLTLVLFMPWMIKNYLTDS